MMMMLAMVNWSVSSLHLPESPVKHTTPWVMRNMYAQNVGIDAGRRNHQLAAAMVHICVAARDRGNRMYSVWSRRSSLAMGTMSLYFSLLL